jgi:iron(III) transport system substrate-binding protein
MGYSLSRMRLAALALVGCLALAACGQTAPGTSNVPNETTNSTSVSTAVTAAPAEATTATDSSAVTAEAGATTEANAASTASGDLVIYSGRSEALIRPVIDLFQKQNPQIQVKLKAGSNNEMAAALLEETANPQADLFIATDMLIVANLGSQGVFEVYQPAGADTISTEYRDPENTWTSFTGRARVIMYNADLVTPEEVPTSVFELTDPKWKGQIAAAGSTNGSMQAHIAAISELQGEAKAEEWLQGLLANEVKFFGGHTDVRKAVGAGEFKLGLVNHYYYHLQKAEPSDNNVGVVYPDQGEGQMGVVVNTTAGGVVKGGPNPAAAKAFVDFLLTPEAQHLFAELNYEYPLTAGVELTEGVTPLDGLKLAEVSMRSIYEDLEATQALIQKVNLP